MSQSIQKQFGKDGDIYGIEYMLDKHGANISDYAEDSNQPKYISTSAVKIDFTGSNRADIKISVCPEDKSGAFSIAGC